MTTDRLAKLQALCGEWGVNTEGLELGPALEALGKAIAESAEVQLRAAQVVILGGDGERAQSRGAMKRLKGIPEVAPFALSPLLVRALVIAGWPEGKGAIAETLVAAWEAPVGQEGRFLEGVRGWRGAAANAPSQSNGHWGTAVIASLDLLWWGQARYCRSRQQPYRKLAPDLQLWLAAEEASSLAVNLPAAPSAAFLVRVLEDLQQDVNDTRTVLDWLTAAWDHLRDNRPSPDNLDPLADTDATGLPISLLRRLARSGDPVSADALRAIHIDPDARIDRGDLASWIFYERLLARRLA